MVAAIDHELVQLGLFRDFVLLRLPLLLVVLFLSFVDLGLDLGLLLFVLLVRRLIQ